MTRDDFKSLSDIRKYVAQALGVSEWASLHLEQQGVVDQAIDAEVGLLPWRIAGRALGSDIPASPQEA